MRVFAEFSRPVARGARGAAQDGEGTEHGTRRRPGGHQADPSRSRDSHESEKSAHGIREHAARYARGCQRRRQNDAPGLSSPGTDPRSSR